MIVILLFLGFFLIYFNKEQIYIKIRETKNEIQIVNEGNIENKILNDIVINHPNNSMSLRSLRKKRRGCRNC